MMGGSYWATTRTTGSLRHWELASLGCRSQVAVLWEEEVVASIHVPWPSLGQRKTLPASEPHSRKALPVSAGLWALVSLTQLCPCQQYTHTEDFCTLPQGILLLFLQKIKRKEKHPSLSISGKPGFENFNYFLSGK